MRKVAIIGGGQSGLQLALGLLQNKYEVTLVSNRTPEQILCGRVTSSQFMFHDSLQNERDLVINFWEKKCPITEGIAFTIPGPDKTKALFWEAKLDHYGQSVEWILDTFMPLEGDRCHNVELTDNNGILVGRFPPIVRKPICIRCRLEQEYRQSEQTWRVPTTNDVCYGDLPFSG